MRGVSAEICSVTGLDGLLAAVEQGGADGILGAGSIDQKSYMWHIKGTVPTEVDHVE